GEAPLAAGARTSAADGHAEAAPAASSGEGDAVAPAATSDEAVADAAPEDDAAEEPATATALPESVPFDVIDLMLRNHAAVKTCFFEHMKAEGSLPPRVTIKLTIQPSGRATAVSVQDRAWAGTPLDRCLSGAV